MRSLIVEDIKVEHPLSKSDQASIIVCVYIQKLQDRSMTKVYASERSDYDLMKKQFDLDWNQYLSQETDVEHKRDKFITKLHKIVECFLQNFVSLKKKRIK